MWYMYYGRCCQTFEGDLYGKKTLIILSSLCGDTKKRLSASPTKDKNSASPMEDKISIFSNQDKMYTNLVVVSVKWGEGVHCIN